MAANSEQLEFIIKAVDEASSAIASVKNSTDSLKKSVDATNSSLEKNSSTVKSTKDSHASMASQVFKGVAAWDLLKKGIGMATDFMKESAQEYLNARQSLDLVRATVESMGMSFDSAKPQLDAYANSMVRMGVDGEDAQLSASKLAKATGDLTKGIELSKLAADLASSGYGDLASNTDALTSVLAGRGSAAIKQYKLSLDSSATSAEILNAMQAKVTQTTEQYADTIPGKIGVVNQAFVELKQQVGEGLVAAMYDAVSSSADMSEGLDGMAQAGQVLKIIVYELVQGFIAIMKAGNLIGAAIAEVILDFEALGKAMTGDFVTAQALMTEGAKNTDGAMASLNKTIGQMLNPMASLDVAVKKVEASHVSLGKSASKAGDDVANAQKTAAEKTVSYADKVKQLSSAFQSMLTASSTDLATMKDDYTKSMDSITASIQKTQKAMSQLNVEFARGQADDTKGVAEQIVASQNKVAQIKANIATATTEDERVELIKQLADEQKNLDSSKDFQLSHITEIAEAQRRAKGTDLQRTIEDYAAKRALALEDYNNKMADLQSELQAQQAQQQAEISLYTQKTAFIKQILDQANADYIKLSKDRVAQTTAEVNASVALFNQLAQAISQARSASASAVSTIAIPVVSGKRAGGGSVMSGNSYVVGEKGQEIFTPDSSGTITPNSKIGGGDNIVVNVTGTFLSNEAAQKMSDLIVQQLRRRTRIGI